MNLEQLIKQIQAERASKLAARNGMARDLEILRDQSTLSASDQERVAQLRTSKEAADAELDAVDARLRALESEKREDDRVNQLQSRVAPTAAASRVSGYAEQRVGEEPQALSRERGEWVRTDTMERADVGRGERFADHPVVSAERSRRAASEAVTAGQFGDLGNLVRSMTTSGGSAVVPAIWASEIIDKARNESAVMRAGATLVPMEAKTVNIGRLSGDPTSAFRTEGSAITASDPTFDNVTLDAKTQSALVVGSLEWFQDASNANELVQNAIAQAMANTTDLAALYGGIVAGAGSINLPTPPSPRGVLAALNATLAGNVLGAAANGTAQASASYWSEILDTIFTVRDRNEEPNGLIWNTKAARQYAKAVDTTGQPLQLPAAVADIPRYSSNQIPSYTQGTMTSRATDVFVGDWTKLLVGQRLDITIQVLTERYAENGQIGIVAHWRGDIQPARSGAFAVYKALQGAL